MLDLQDQILTVLGDYRAQSDDSLAEKLNVACSQIETNGGCYGGWIASGLSG